MKRLTAVILCISTILLLSACGNEPTPVQTTPESTESTTAPTTAPETVTKQMPMLAVSVPAVTRYEKAEDGTHIATITSQDISMTISEPEVADKVIVDFLNRIDIHEEEQSLIESAKNTYALDPEHMSPYLLQLTYDPMRLDPGVLSFFGTRAEYTGGAHGGVVPLSITYDLLSGKVLSLYNILTEDATGEAICKLITDILSKSASDYSLYDGYEITVKGAFQDNFKKNTNWYFSNDGLCFYFAPYEIAPYSSGIIIAEIPYANLVGVLNDAYFPAERQAASGKIIAEAFDGKPGTQFTQFSEIILDKGGEQTLFYTEECIYDLRIESVTWSADGSVCTPVRTVFAAYSLTPGDAIMLEALVGEVLPNLRLTYTSEDKTVVQFITFNGQDGGVVLKNQ